MATELFGDRQFQQVIVELQEARRADIDLELVEEIVLSELLQVLRREIRRNGLLEDYFYL
jgi:hypothetical protein